MAIAQVLGLYRLHIQGRDSGCRIQWKRCEFIRRSRESR